MRLKNEWVYDDEPEENGQPGPTDPNSEPTPEENPTIPDPDRP